MKKKSVSNLEDDSYGYGRSLSKYTNEELVASFNREVGIPAYIRARMEFIRHLKNELLSRGLDYSAFVWSGGMSLRHRIKLVGNKCEVMCPRPSMIHYPIYLSTCAKKNVYMNDAGVFQSAQFFFGDVISLAAKSKPFIKVEQMAGPDVDFAINYRFSNSGFMQLILQVDEVPISIIAEFEVAGKSLTEALIYALEVYLQGYIPFTGSPQFEESDILTEYAYDQMIEKLQDQIGFKFNPELESRTKLIQHLGDLGLNPIHYGWDLTSWFARCPGSGGSHFLNISSKSDHWGCCFCHRHGDYLAFDRWLAEIYRRTGFISSAEITNPNNSYRGLINQIRGNLCKLE